MFTLIIILFGMLILNYVRDILDREYGAISKIEKKVDIILLNGKVKVILCSLIIS